MSSNSRTPNTNAKSGTQYILKKTLLIFLPAFLLVFIVTLSTLSSFNTNQRLAFQERENYTTDIQANQLGNDLWNNIVISILDRCKI